jgi:hypothetical protein
MKNFVLLSVAFILFTQSTHAYEGPAPLQDIKIGVTVSLDGKTGVYRYLYTVTNSAKNDGQIRSIRIATRRDPATQSELASTGLKKCVKDHTADWALQKYPFVPVGSEAPAPWSCGCGAVPELAGISCGWGASQKTYINPGATLTGFALTSFGLPGLNEVLVEPKIHDNLLPPDFEGDPDKIAALENKVKWVGQTVGPKAPPKVFAGSDFLNNLIALANQSRANGWIDSDGVLNSLLAKLNDAAKKLAAGDVKTTKNVLGAFLNDTQAQNGKHLTSEAYALLYFNGKYLVDHL